MNIKMTTKKFEDKRRQADEIKKRLEGQGYRALWGGKKGHGFWISKDGYTCQNDGKKSGNVNFWMMREVLALLDGRIEPTQGPYHGQV